MLKKLHELTSNEALSFEQKIHALLELGLTHFEQDHAIISHIQGDQYTVEYVVSDNPDLVPGLQFELGNTYCWHTLQAGDALAFSHAGQSRIAGHPCYQNFKLESYIGARIVVQGKLYGTLNFTSALPKAVPFTGEEIDFITLFAQWIGVEMSRRLDRQHLNQRIELQQEMEQLAQIGCWEVDVVENTIYWSDQVRKIHEVPDDYEPDLATAIEFYAEGEDRDRIANAVAQAMEAGTCWSEEVRLRTYTGNIKWVATQGRAELKNGRCVRMFGAFQDIDAQMKMRQALISKRQEAERLLQARSAMIGKISHELRTPINGIAGMLQTLVGESNPDIIESRVDIALRSADLLVRLVNDVLDYSKVESGQLEFEAVAFTPYHVFNDLYHLYSPLANNKGVHLEFDVAVAQQVRAIGDAGRLTQIYSNLLNNAIKFTEHGEVTLTARLKNKPDGQRLGVTITDTGIGMNTSTLESLYQPFKQGGAGVAARYGGSGLGFAIVKELCDALNGSIKVSSEEGKGTRIYVEMPLIVNEDEQVESTEQYVGPKNASFEHLKLLVVDDNEINRLVMESLLSQLQISADYAVNGVEAIACVERAANEPYTLIFMDCEMPVMGGIQATEVIRESDKGNGKVFVVAMTADTSEANRAACLKAGMDAFITKPVKLDGLRSVLQEVAYPKISAAPLRNSQ